MRLCYNLLWALTVSVIPLLTTGIASAGSGCHSSRSCSSGSYVGGYTSYAAPNSSGYSIQQPSYGYPVSEQYYPPATQCAAPIASAALPPVPPYYAPAATAPQQYPPQQYPPQQYPPQQYAAAMPAAQAPAASTTQTSVAVSQAASPSADVLALIELSRRQQSTIDELTRGLQRGEKPAPSLDVRFDNPAPQTSPVADQPNTDLLQALVNVIMQHESQGARR